MFVRRSLDMYFYSAYFSNDQLNPELDFFIIRCYDENCNTKHATKLGMSFALTWKKHREKRI